MVEDEGALAALYCDIIGHEEEDRMYNVAGYQLVDLKFEDIGASVNGLESKIPQPEVAETIGAESERRERHPNMAGQTV